MDALTIATLGCTPNKNQELVINSEKPYLLISGGIGNDKTVALCLDAILNAVKFPNNHLAIVRNDYSTLKRITWEAFKSICPINLIKSFSDISLTARFHNGSILRFFETNYTKKPSLSINGLDFGWAGIECAEEVDEEVFTKLKTRMRLVLPGGKLERPDYKIRLAASNLNPQWLADFAANQTETQDFINFDI
jgi:phage terminase large subunit